MDENDRNVLAAASRNVQNCGVEGGRILAYSRDGSRNGRQGQGRTSTGTGIPRVGLTGGCETMRTAVIRRVSTRFQ